MRQPQHWPERAMEQAEAISDAWEVCKVYAGRLAEWVLFGCMVANLIEVVVTVPPGFGSSVLIVQAITLDIAGFGLASMAAQARRQGREQAARTARVMGWTLIVIMMLTVGLITLAVKVPSTKSFVDAAENVLMLVRVLATVLYGHVIHSLREANVQYTNQVTSLQEELARRQEERDRAQQQVASGQAEVSRLRVQLDTKSKEVDGLRGQVASGQREVDTLHMQLDTLRGQGDSGQAEVDTLRKQLQSALAEVETGHAVVSAKQHELQGGQAAVDTCSIQCPVNGHTWTVDRKKRERGQQQAEQAVSEHIKALLTEQPGLSDRAIASKVACSPTTVGKWRKSLASASVNEEASL
ncbi:MAG: hypothetical protein JO202_19990 [Ktedonobacteraceae bacterium]|nr:hypothetical protein [Ktedonobacteraceae bacterium]